MDVLLNAFKSGARPASPHRALAVVALSIAIIALWLLPDWAHAQTSKPYSFELPEELVNNSMSMAGELWDYVANIGIYVGLVGGILAYALGETRFVRWALAIAFIAGFGDEILKGLAGSGGLKLWDGSGGSTTLVLPMDALHNLAAGAVGVAGKIAGLG